MSNSRLTTLTWIVAISALFLYVMSPYFQPILWALVFAIIFGPLRQWLLKHARLGRTGSTLATILASGLLVVIPSIVILASLADDIAAFGQELSSREMDAGTIFASVKSMLPERVSNWLSTLDVGSFAEIRSRIVSALTSLVGNTSNYLVNLGQNTLLFIVAIGVMFYLLFFFLNNGEQIRDTILRYAPVDDKRKRRLAATTKNVIRATVQGNIVIAAIQGAIGGVTLWMLGVGGSLILGVMMAGFSLLPAVGASIVWIPVALWLVFKGDIGSAVILTLVGVLIIGLIDNLLRPLLVSKDANLPDYMTFLATIGGIAFFGISGFVLGPLVVALFVETARWAGEHKSELPAPIDQTEP